MFWVIMSAKDLYYCTHKLFYRLLLYYSFNYILFLVTSEPDAPITDLSPYVPLLDEKSRKKLRVLCWETMFGRELVKIIVMDLVCNIVITLFSNSYISI